MPTTQPKAKPSSTRVSPRPSIFTMIFRGSAPAGTFDIPEEGLPVPHARSFFARFQEGLPVAESSLQKYAQIMEAVELASTNEQTSKKECNEEDFKVEVVHGIEKRKDKRAKTLTEGHLSGSRPVSQQTDVCNGGKDKQPNDLEIAADVAEDSLIEVIDEQISLLSDCHASYPALRFCAANALVDRHALDALVGLCALTVSAGKRGKQKSVES